LGNLIGLEGFQIKTYYFNFIYYQNFFIKPGLLDYSWKLKKGWILPLKEILLFGNPFYQRFNLFGDLTSTIKVKVPIG